MSSSITMVSGCRGNGRGRIKRVASCGVGLVGRRGAVMPMRVVGVVVPIRHVVVLPRRGIGDVGRRGCFSAGDGDGGGVRIIGWRTGMPMAVVGVVVFKRCGVILPRRGIGNVGRGGYFAAGGRTGSKWGGDGVGRRRTGMPMRVVGVVMPVRRGVILPRRGIGDVERRGYFAA